MQSNKWPIMYNSSNKLLDISAGYSSGFHGLYFIFRFCFFLIFRTYFAGNPSSIPTSNDDGEKIDEVRGHDEENL